VEVVAWVGLLGSWLALVVILKLVFLMLRVLKQIRRLVEMTRDAARHLADNVDDEQAFAEFELLLGELPDAVGRLPLRAAAARPNVSSLSPGIAGRFP
jgi:HAMP domain-containing protein